MNVDLESLETNRVHKGELSEVIQMVYELVQYGIKLKHNLTKILAIFFTKLSVKISFYSFYFLNEL